MSVNSVLPTQIKTVAARMVDGVKVYGKGEAEVHALDGVNVEFLDGQFTAIMGPSGSGKSTLLHCLAGLDKLTSGRVVLDEVDLGSLDDRALTILRRERLGFVFQAFNLVPTLTASENVLLPLTLGGRQPDRSWFEHLVGSLRIADRLSTGRPNFPEASNNEWRWRERWSAGPSSSSPTSRRGTWTRRRQRSCWSRSVRR